MSKSRRSRAIKIARKRMIKGTTAFSSVELEMLNNIVSEYLENEIFDYQNTMCIADENLYFVNHSYDEKYYLLMNILHKIKYHYFNTQKH